MPTIKDAKLDVRLAPQPSLWLAPQPCRRKTTSQALDSAGAFWPDSDVEAPYPPHRQAGHGRVHPMANQACHRRPLARMAGLLNRHRRWSKFGQQHGRPGGKVASPLFPRLRSSAHRENMEQSGICGGIPTRTHSLVASSQDGRRTAPQGGGCLQALPEYTSEAKQLKVQGDVILPGYFYANAVLVRWNRAKPGPMAG